MKIPFWEETYHDDTISVFGTEPNASLLEFMDCFDASWKVLDVGCGDGKNSFYLAGQGFSHLDAFDLSENAIAKLHRLADKRGLSINAWVQDLRRYVFTAPYDLVMSFGTLHFVPKEDWKGFLQEAKAHTNPGGIHVMQLFTNDLPPSPDIAAFAVGFADDGELRTLYEDWNVLQFRSYAFEDEHPGVPKHRHAANKIIAQKPPGAV